MSTSLVLARSGSIARSANILALESDWLAALALRVRAGALSETTKRTYAIGLARFLDWCADVSEIGQDTILEWLAHLRSEGHKSATINTWLAGVRAFFAWASGAHLIPYNPASGIRGAKRTSSHKHKRDELTDAEMRRVLESPSTDEIGQRDRAMISLMAYTAARTIEVHRADLADLKTRRGRMVLEVRGKGRAEADEFIVIAHAQAEAAMHDWLSVRGRAPGPLFTSLSNRSKGERLSLPAIRHIVKQYYALAGVSGKAKTTHSLRHTAITTAIRRGAQLQKVKSMARHSSVDTTMIYFHEVDRIEHPAEEFIDYSGDKPSSN